MRALQPGDLMKIGYYSDGRRRVEDAVLRECITPLSSGGNGQLLLEDGRMIDAGDVFFLEGLSEGAEDV